MNDLLGLVAELAVGLTGFAAVAAALGHAPSQADVRLDRVRLRSLVELGIVTTLLAVLPSALWPSEPTPPWVWTVSGIVMVTGGVGIAYAQTRRVYALGVPRMKGYSRSGALVAYVLAYGSLLLVTAGVVLPPVPTDRAYVGALFMLLSMVGFNFVRVATSLLAHQHERDE